MQITTEETNRLDNWSKGGGLAIRTVRCDRCGIHPTFYIEIPVHKTASTWVLCTPCARRLTHKDPLSVFQTSTGLPVGKTI